MVGPVFTPPPVGNMVGDRPIIFNTASVPAVESSICVVYDVPPGGSTGICTKDICLSLLDFINLTTRIVHHFAVFHTLEEDKKEKDELVDILIQRKYKNLENLPCLVVPSTVVLYQSKQMSQAPLLAATSESMPQIATGGC
jgi:hypothetical protein